MIVSEKEALLIFEKLPIEMQSYYFHPTYISCDAQYKDDTEPLFFVIESEQNIFYHAFHLGKVLGTKYKDIQSPYGYGGPLCVGNKKFIDIAVKKYKEWCLQNNVLVEFIRFYPLFQNEKSYYGSVSENRQTVWIDLTNEGLLSSFQTRARTAIRKARKNNVNIIFSKNKKYVLKFIELYTALMNQKEAAEDYYFNEEYFWSLIYQEHVHLINAENEQGDVIGAALFFAHGDTVEYHLSTSDFQGRKLSVANLLIYEFAEFAKARNYSAMYLGGGNNREENNSLLFFKKGFSMLTADFNIGSTIYYPKDYENLKKLYCSNGDIDDMKKKLIIFYR